MTEEYFNYFNTIFHWLCATRYPLSLAFRNIFVIIISYCTIIIFLCCFFFLDDVEIDTNSTVEQQLFSLTNHFVKVLRIIFVRSKTTSSLAYGTICLTSKLFLPVRLGQKSYETMPVTVWRIASWLRAAGENRHLLKPTSICIL